MGESLFPLCLPQAGGLDADDVDKVFVVRRHAGSPVPEVIELSFRQAKPMSTSNIPIQPGDIVSVGELPAGLPKHPFNNVNQAIHHLRDDVRELHRDVKRLRQLLEKRAEQSQNDAADGVEELVR